jgi:hypothetical protein
MDGALAEALGWSVWRAFQRRANHPIWWSLEEVVPKRGHVTHKFTPTHARTPQATHTPIKGAHTGRRIANDMGDTPVWRAPSMGARTNIVRAWLNPNAKP